MGGLRVGAAGSAAVEGIQILRAVPCGHLSQLLCNASNTFYVPANYVREDLYLFASLSTILGLWAFSRRQSCNQPMRLEAMYLVQ